MLHYISIVFSPCYPISRSHRDGLAESEVLVGKRLGGAAAQLPVDKLRPMHSRPPSMHHFVGHGMVSTNFHRN